MKRSHAFAGFTAAALAIAVLYACSGDDSSSNNGTTNGDAGPISHVDGATITPNDSGNINPTNDVNQPQNDAQPPDCFQGTPTTYLEIINACTDAQAVDKTVDLPTMNLTDGGLKPLP